MKRRVFIPLFVAVLGFLLGTFLAPLAMEVVLKILELDYRIPRSYSPTEREMRKVG